MTSVRARVLVLGAMALGLVSVEAQAWGPAAQEAITWTAIQRIEEKYPAIFESESGAQNYESDVVRGAVDGAEKLVEAMNIRTDRDAIEAIGNQILLLREVRKNGIGSYFSYRMGLLSAIVSDALLPYALDNTDATAEMRARIESDIDSHVKRYRYAPERHLQVVLNVSQYIESYRPFYNDAKRIIAEDYRTGKGYSGYLANAGPSFFGESVEATADVWYTILRAPDGTLEAQPSPEAVAWYFVNEMEYLLKVKRNVAEAMKKYATLERLSATAPAVFERVGDLFYAYGVSADNRDMRERAVQEWENALDLPGCDRKRLSSKLSEYYIELGRSHVKAAEEPGGYKRLTDALASFSRALEYSHESPEAERLLSETRELKRDMDEALETQTGIINSAEKVMREAKQSEEVQDYANALTWYASARDLFGKVGGQFPELQKAAEERSNEIKVRINTIKEESLNRARQTIAKGDEALEAKNYEEAIDTYMSVEQVVSPITDDPSTPHGKRRDELLNESRTKVSQAEDAKSKAEEAARNAANNPAGAPGAPAR